MAIPKELDDGEWSNWSYAFAEEGDGNFEQHRLPEIVPPGATGVDGSWFGREDVAEVLHVYEGDPDEWDGIFVGRLHDGRFAAVMAWCDYTGWG